MTDWQKLAYARRQKIRSQIPPEWILSQDEIARYQHDILAAPKILLTPEEFNLTESKNAKVLLDKMASGDVLALSVCKAFMHRAAIATQLTNCATEIFFDVGIKRAEELDKYFKDNDKLFGPFHGLPISLKDSYNVPGVDSTLGAVAQIGNADQLKQSHMVSMLLDLGAVLYIKTNIPQTLMTADSENNLFGRTLNPNNPSLTSGGLSGGEGAMVRQRGSIIGVGTDIAGSIRIPSLCCGTYGFKPSSDRVPYGRQRDGVPTYLGIAASAGPLANSFEDLKFFFKEVLNRKPWNYDFNTVNVPYIEPEAKETLAIGVIYEDPGLPVLSPVRRNLKEAAKLLEQAGHRIVELEKFPSFENAYINSFHQFYTQVEGEVNPLKVYTDAGEPVIKSLSQTGETVYLKKAPDTLEEIVVLYREAKNIAEDWHNIFCDQKLDVILCPGAPTTAPPHDTYGIPPYTCMWNLVNYPALVIPYTGAQNDDDDIPPQYPAHLNGIYAKYDKASYEGGIGSIQLVAPTNSDEALLSAGELIDNALKA